MALDSRSYMAPKVKSTYRICAYSRLTTVADKDFDDSRVEGAAETEVGLHHVLVERLLPGKAVILHTVGTQLGEQVLPIFD